MNLNPVSFYSNNYCSTDNSDYNDMIFAQDVYHYKMNIVIINIVIMKVVCMTM